MKRTKKVLATILSFLLCLSMFTNIAHAEGNEPNQGNSGESGTATIYKIFAEMNQTGPDFDTLVIADSAPEGKVLIAKYITDGTYIPKISGDDTTDADIALLLNNVTIDLSQIPVDVNIEDLNWLMSGTSIVTFPDETLSTFDGKVTDGMDVFPEYTGNVNVEELFGFYNSYPYENVIDENNQVTEWKKMPLHTVTGNYQFEGELNTVHFVVNEGATLEMKAIANDHGESSGGIFEATNIELNGTIKMDQPTIENEPPLIRVWPGGSFTLGTNGIIDVPNGTELTFYDNATCNDSIKVLLFRKDDTDALVPYEWNDDHGEVTFIYSDNDNKWILRGPHFGVDYDDWGGQASVTANGAPLRSGDMMPFKPNEDIEFTFTMPDDRAGCTPYICIESDNNYWFCTWEDGANHLEVLGNTFSFTPPDENEFWVRFWWSDYDIFGPEPDEFMVETRCDRGTAYADLSGINGINSMNEPNKLSGLKQIFAYEALNDSLNNQITFTFTPEDNNKYLNEVEIWYDGGERKYSLNDYNDPRWDRINESNGFSENNGVYTYTFDFAGIQTSHISVNVRFEDPQGGRIKEDKFFVEFDPWGHWDEIQREDVPTAFVKMGTTNIDRYDNDKGEPLYDYTPETEYTFTLEGPQERNGCTPIVEIETGSGEYYSSDSNRINDDNFLINLDNNSFKFTPKDNKGFMIRVNWSDYDCFNPNGQNQFMIETKGDNGTVVANLNGVTVINSMDEPNGLGGKKQIINRSNLSGTLNNKITFTFTPNTDRRLAGVDFWLDQDEKRYSLRLDDDPNSNRELINENNGFTEENGVYTYTFDFTGYETGHITASAYFEDYQDDDFKANMFFVDYDERGDNNGKVYVGEDFIHAFDYGNKTPYKDYTLDKTYTFSLQTPEERTGCTPIVEVETFIGERYSSRENDVDAAHLITIGQDNTFSFTPKDKLGFKVKVWWSEYDYYGHSDNEFLLTTEYWDKEDGTVEVNKNPKDSIQEDNGRTGLKRCYANEILDENTDLIVTITPKEGYHLRSVGLNINIPGRDGTHFDYVNREPDPNNSSEKYIFETGSGFTEQGGSIIYKVPKELKGGDIWINVDFKENHDDIVVNPNGGTVKYSIDDGAFTALPEGNTLKQEVFENANKIQFKFTRQEGDEKGVEVKIKDDDGDECWLKPLPDNKIYTIEKTDLGGEWKGLEISLITWDAVYDGQYMLNWFGPEDIMPEANGLERDKAYDMPANNGAITFSFNEPVSKVFACPNWKEWKEITADNNGVYSYTPDSNAALTFRIYKTEEEYNYYEKINPDHSKDQFSAEYDVNVHLDDNHNVVPGLGGTVTYNVETINTGELSEIALTKENDQFIRNKKKLILQGGNGVDAVKSITLTVTPNIGCEYDFWERDQDLTQQVKDNGNVYVWDVSDPWDIPWICVDFHSNNTPLSGDVTISGTAKYGEELTVVAPGEVNQEALQYQWYRDGSIIPGETNATYTAVEDDINTYLSCNVTSVLQPGELTGQTSKIEKLDGPEAPTGIEGVAPSRAGYSDGKITGVDTSMEYSKQDTFNNSTDCTGNEITNLGAGTYYVRIKETNIRKPSAAVQVIVDDGPEDIKGTVTINGTPKYLETLTAVVSDSNATEFNYQWYRGDESISGATSSTYTLVQADIGKIIKCEVSDKNGVHQGSISEKSEQISKADGPTKPTGLTGVAPSRKGYLDGKITGVTSDMEYSKQDSFNNATPCTGTEITGLGAGTYYVRVKATDTNEAGEAEEVILAEGPADLTGEVTISGTTKYGETLTAIVTDINASEYTYQWKRGGAEISGETASTYTLGEDDIGETISCVITGVGGTTLGEISGSASSPISKADGPTKPTGLTGVAPSREGSSDGKIIGISDQMEYATQADSDVWTSINGEEITGLSAGTYYVRYKENNTHLAGDYAEVTVDDGPEDITATFSITGNPRFGQLLVASVSGCNVEEEDFVYQWKRGDEVISGETSFSHQVVQADIGQIITCIISDRNEYHKGTISAQTGIISKAAGPSGPSGLKGIAPSRKGYSDGKITGVSDQMEYATQSDSDVWTSINGEEITGLGAGTYYVRFKENDTYEVGSSISVTVNEGPEDLSGTVTISGTTKYGETLNATVSGSNASAFKYQWKRDGNIISGATSSAYVLAKDDIGKTISCEISDADGNTYGSISGQASEQISKADSPVAPTGLSGVAPSKAGKDDGKITGVNSSMEYATKADFSDKKECTSTVITGLKAGTYFIRLKETETTLAGNYATITVKEGPVDLRGTVSISGTAKFGQTLTASVTGSNASTFNYQWKRENNNISNATSSTYKLVKEDIGQIVTCVVSDKSGNTLGTISGSSAKIEKTDGPAAPTNLKGVACAYKGSADGQITGVNTSMEYAAKSDFSDKKKCSSSSITGLKAGTYYVRIAETDTAKAGAATTVTVDDGKEEVPQTQDELVKAFVKRFYDTILQRPSDEKGLNDWANALISGQITATDAAHGFVFSEEFVNKNYSNEEFVTRLYSAFFNREAAKDPNGASTWINLLNNGASREDVFAGFVNSDEFRKLCDKYGMSHGPDYVPGGNNSSSQNQNQPEQQPPAQPQPTYGGIRIDASEVDDSKLDEFMERLYVEVLGRASDPQGKKDWANAIKSGQFDGGKVARIGFFCSDEYLGKNKTNEEFVHDAYRAFFGRDEDPEGYKMWVEGLYNGTFTREQVIEIGFGYSDEFMGILERYGFKIYRD